MKFEPTKLVKHLEEKWGGRPCPMCGSKSFEISELVFQLMEFYPHGTVIGAPVNPVVPIVCTNCGNTILVNALVTGLVQQPSPPTKEGVK